MDQIHIVKQLMEKSYEFNQDLFLPFTDYKQAYDSVTRASLWSVMLKFVISEKLAKIIRLCVIYSTKYKVRYNQQISDEFCAETGLRQGDGQSPMLFSIALEYVARTIIETNKSAQVQDNILIT